MEEKKQSQSFWTIIIEKIAPIFSWLFVVLSLALQIGAQNSMGIYRDLVYRNWFLTNTLMTKKFLKIYQWSVLLGIGFCITIFLLRKIRPLKDYIIGSLEYRWNRYLRRIICLSVVCFCMIIIYERVTWIAYPWILLSILITVCVHYIRLTYVGFQIIVLKKRGGVAK